MVDMLPFPRISGRTAEEKINELNNYLIQFKETLEFILTNISTDNLSDELIKKLNELGAEIEKRTTDTEEQMQQVSNNSLSVSDVINSDLFKAEIEKSVEFTVNFDTGYLEYTRP